MSNSLPLTLEQLKIGLVRCAERWPDRIGLRGKMCDGSHADHCILGQISFDYGRCSGLAGTYAHPLFAASPDFRHGTALSNLLCRAAYLNNQGLPWRQIVIELGLVPGEQPAEIPAQIDRRVLTEKEEVHA